MVFFTESPSESVNIGVVSASSVAEGTIVAEAKVLRPAAVFCLVPLLATEGTVLDLETVSKR